jgi:outer membrane lipoprotein-sorting protein
MIRRTMMCCVSLVVAGLAVQAARADSLADVKKKIESQSQSHQTLRQEMRMTTDMPGTAGKMTSTGTMEFARRGKDKWVMRSDTVMKMPKQEGQPELEPMKSTAINDGQYLYSITDQGGQKTAMKMKADQGGQKAADPTGFGEMEKQYDLKLLPDEKVDGKNTWVIEAKPKQDQMGGIDRVVMYYDQANGVAVKTVTYDKAGKALSTIEMTKVEVDVKIPDERFTVPAGVQVTDMTALTESQGAGASTSQGSTQDDQAAAKSKPSDKPKDDSGSATPPPAQKAPASAPAKPTPADKAKDATKKGIKGLF